MKILIFGLFLTFNLFASVITVGSKPTTEGLILSEIIAQALETTGEVQVERKFRIGETAIILESLKSEQIDIYPEYSGKIADMLISAAWDKTLPKVRGALAGHKIIASGTFGFNKAATLVVKKENSKFKDINTISDLKQISGFKGGFSYKFLRSQRGLFPLLKIYGINQKKVRKMSQARMIETINSGEVEIIEMDPTNSDIIKYNLKSLKDDKEFLPQYRGLLLVKKDFPTKYPASWKILYKILVNKITAADMAWMNAQVDLKGESYSAVAGRFLQKSGLDTRFSMWKQIYPKLKDHLAMVAIPLILSTLTGLFLVVMAARIKGFETIISSVNRFYRPIPFLIILGVLIPFLGAGKLPVYVTLFIFGIFPIIKWATSTNQGNANLSWWGKSMSSHNIWAGIKNTAFINVGMATLAAYIGAGGLGDLIISGLTQKDQNLILMGVVPAIILVVLIHLVIELSDKYTRPKGA